MTSPPLVQNLSAIRDPYALAQAAGAAFATMAEEARGHYIRALTALKLTHAARRLSGLPVEPGGGLVPWSSRGRRFAANLRALAGQHPAEAALVESAAADLATFELHLAADGNYQVLDTHMSLPGGWLGNLADHKSATRLWEFDRAKTPTPSPIVYESAGFGWLLLHMLESTAHSYLNYSTAFYVLERDPLALAMLFHMHDLQNVLAGASASRLRWFVGAKGADVLRQFEQAVDAHPAWTVPTGYVRCMLRQPPHDAGLMDIEGTIKRLQTAREARRNVLLSQTQAYYADKSAAFWAGRFQEASENPAQPLRVLGITSRFTTVLQYSMRELQAAAETLGIHMELSLEPDDQSLEHPFLQDIATFKPDLIVQLSRLRYENPYLPRNVPFLCWDQDNLPCMRTSEATASLNALTYVAGHGAIFGYGHLRWQEKNCIFCHPAGAAERYHSGPISEDLRVAHACDISYVSNASESPEALAQRLRERWRAHPQWLAFFDGATREIHEKANAGTCWDDVSIDKLLQSAPADPAPRYEMKLDLHRHADRCFRHATLTWVSRWCAANGRIFRLYGRGWDTHPEFRRWHAGTAEPGEEFRAIYQASRINLQLIESGFIHSRSLDGLAAGGFFLTRHVPADGTDPQTLREIHLLGQAFLDQGIHSATQLAAHPDLQPLWERMLAFHPWPPEHAIRVAKVWAHTPHPVVAFPMLPDISFRDESSFGALASLYLADDALRQSFTTRMRQIVLERFSYQSRWKQFLSHVSRGLAPAARASQ